MPANLAYLERDVEQRLLHKRKYSVLSKAYAVSSYPETLL